MTVRQCRPKKLNPDQEHHIITNLFQHRPDTLGVSNIPLWDKGSIQALAQRHCGVRLSAATVELYLKSWGLFVKRLRKETYAHRSEKARMWIEKKYPEIRKRAKEEEAVVWWLGEVSNTMSSQSETATGPAVIRGNVIAAMAHHRLARMAFYKEAIDALGFIDFLERLEASSPGKNLVILGDHSVHYDSSVRAWAASKSRSSELVYICGSDGQPPLFSSRLQCPERIADVERIEEDMRAYCVAPERYWLLTTEMKIAVASGQKAVLSRLFRELQNVLEL